MVTGRVGFYIHVCECVISDSYAGICDFLHLHECVVIFDSVCVVFYSCTRVCVSVYFCFVYMCERDMLSLVVDQASHSF